MPAESVRQGPSSSSGAMPQQLEDRGRPVPGAHFPKSPSQSPVFSSAISFLRLDLCRSHSLYASDSSPDPQARSSASTLARPAPAHCRMSPLGIDAPSPELAPSSNEGCREGRMAKRDFLTSGGLRAWPPGGDQMLPEAIAGAWPGLFHSPGSSHVEAMDLPRAPNRELARGELEAWATSHERP